MAAQRVASVSLLAILTLLVGTVQSIGVCYGTNGNNLPTPADVVQLYQSNLIDWMRIYYPNATILHALRGTKIAVVVDAPDVRSLASDDVNSSSSSPARAWVQTNVQPYYPDVNIKYIAVEMSVVAGSPLPSGSAFADTSIMGPIVKFLASNGSPLLSNVYPYYAYKSDDGVDLNFSLFQPSSTTIDDNGHTYTNLFDAMVDSIYSAMEKVGEPGVAVVLSETGWPSAGARGASKDSARVYNQNLINHVGKGTPKRPGALETYIFAMFDENQKEDGIERHFGLFSPDKSPVYSINFSGTSDSGPQASMGWAERPVCYAIVIVGLSLVLLLWPVRR